MMEAAQGSLPTDFSFLFRQKSEKKSAQCSSETYFSLFDECQQQGAHAAEADKASRSLHCRSPLPLRKRPRMRLSPRKTQKRQKRHAAHASGSDADHADSDKAI